MGTPIIIILGLIFSFFFFFWIQGASMISHQKKLDRERAEHLGYTKEDAKEYGSPEGYLQHLEERQKREEQLEGWAHEANLEDPNYYNRQ